MRLRKSALLAAGVTLATALATVNVVAELDPGGGSVVAKVGSRSVTARAFVQRLAVVPDFQLRDVRFLADRDQAQLPGAEWWCATNSSPRGAEAKKLDQVTRARERVDHALRNARINLLRENLDVSAGEIASYFAENRARFEAPGAHRGDAHPLRDAQRGRHRPRGRQSPWEPRSAGTSFTREHSLDKTTSMRGGALGFLAQDGSSSEASVQVDPAALRGRQQSQGRRVRARADRGRERLRRDLAPREHPRRASHAGGGNRAHPADPRPPKARRRRQGAHRLFAQVPRRSKSIPIWSISSRSVRRSVAQRKRPGSPSDARRNPSAFRDAHRPPLDGIGVVPEAGGVGPHSGFTPVGAGQSPAGR